MKIDFHAHAFLEELSPLGGKRSAVSRQISAFEGIFRSCSFG